MKVVKTTFYRVLVKVDKTREQQQKEEGKIILSSDYQDDKYATAAQTTGVIISMGDQAFNQCETPQCKIGDRVVFKGHSGIRLIRHEDPENQKKTTMYRLLNDDEIYGVVELEEADYKDLSDECRNS